MSSLRRKPDAVIFIPGIGSTWDGPVVDGLGERFAFAIDRNTPPQLLFHAKVDSEELPDPFRSMHIARVSVSDSRKDGGEQDPGKPLVDLYVLDLPALLIEPHRAAGAVKKGLKLVFRILSLSSRMTRALTSKNKGYRMQLQLIGGAIGVLLLVLGLVALLPTLIAGFVALLPLDNPRLDTFKNWALPIGATLGVGLAMLPSTWRSMLDSATTLILSVTSYASIGEERDVVVGRLATFLERLAEGDRYERIHIISYSMGSLIALDALFPPGPPILRFSAVDTLITIGCPADMVKMYWPEYFQERHRIKGTPRSWTNFFVPADLFGSNFVDGDDDCEGEYQYSRHIGFVKIPFILRKASWSGVKLSDGEEDIHPNRNVRHTLTARLGQPGFTWAALSAHRAYWHPSSTSAASVFDMIAQELFPSSEELEQYAAGV